MTVEEARDRYPDSWVLMRVGEFDSYHRPLRGYVLTQSRSRRAISNRLAQEPPRSELPKHEGFYIFHTSLRPIQPAPEAAQTAAKFLAGLISSAGAMSGPGRG
jgi:hypothetical protein